MDGESLNWYLEVLIGNQLLAVTKITEYCVNVSDNDQSIVILLSYLTSGAEFTIPDQQPMKSILYMIGQNIIQSQLVCSSVIVNSEYKILFFMK